MHLAEANWPAGPAEGKGRDLQPAPAALDRVRSQEPLSTSKPRGSELGVGPRAHIGRVMVRLGAPPDQIIWRQRAHVRMFPSFSAAAGTPGPPLPRGGDARARGAGGTNETGRAGGAKPCAVTAAKPAAAVLARTPALVQWRIGAVSAHAAGANVGQHE
jgi:hypothetical protein